MKKLLSVVLALAIIICLFPVGMIVADADDVVENGFKFNCENETSIIVDYLNTERNVVIPSTLGGYPVVEIASYAFYDKDITSVAVPETVTRIAEYAFCDCTALTQITLPNTAISINESAFVNTAYYNNNSNWNNNVLYIGNHLIAAKDEGPGASYTVKSGTITIADFAFCYQYELEKIIIPNGVLHIGRNAFDSCGSLATIVLPDSIKSIGYNAFLYTAYSENNDNWENNVLYIDNYLVGANEDLYGNYSVKDGTTCIANGVFSECYYLEEITIPDSVLYIGEAALSYCGELNTVVIGNGASEISKDLFKNCNNLSSVTFGGVVKAIRSGAFEGCSSLMVIEVPEGITRVEQNAFRDCSSLYSVRIPSTLSYIGVSAFENTGIKEVYIPSLEAWCNIYFDGCEKLGMTVWNGSAYSNPLFDCGRLYVNGELLTTLTIPSTITEINPGAFVGFDAITSVTIHENVTKIGAGAFYNCEQLEKVILLANTLTINNNAFDACYNLKEVYSPSLEAWCNINFGNISANPLCYARNLYINNELLTELITPTTVTKINDYAFYNCESLKTVVVSNGVTEIGQYAFGENSINYIYLPSTIQKIQKGAFAGWDYWSIFDVWYAGSNRILITIFSENNNLLDATWHYDSCPTTHNYSSECDFVCDICAWVRTVSAEHNYKTTSYNNDYHWKECVCGLRIEEKYHSFENVCDTTCPCGYTRSVLDHFYSSATCTKPKTCIYCGTTTGKKLSHTYNNHCDKDCNACGYVRTVGDHKYDSGKITTKPNCTKTGVKTYTCTECGKQKTESIAKLTTHTYASATCTKAKTCKVCGITSGKALGHKYKTTTTKATLSKNGKIVKACTVCKKVASTTTIKYAKSFKLSATSYTYNGKAKTPSVTVKDSSGKTLKKNIDYTVTYASGRKAVGTYKVTIKMKGNYSGTKTLTFKINPVKTSVSKLTAGKKSITVNISKKSTQVTGYQVQYSTSKSFSSTTTKTISSYKTTKYTLKSLSAKKTYYVRVRTYKTVNGKKYYSGWSAYKNAKTK